MVIFTKIAQREIYWYTVTYKGHFITNIGSISKYKFIKF